MALSTTSLVHKKSDLSDEDLEKEATDHLGQYPNLQALNELLKALRMLNPSWWSAEKRREALPAVERMRMLKQRPDLRANVMRIVASAPPKFARRCDPEFQASIIDECLFEDTAASTFEDAFSTETLVVYGDAASIYFQFRDALPWTEDSEIHQTIVMGLIESFLADRSPHGGKSLKPILNHWEVVNAIDPATWHNKIPLDVRATVHKAWLAQEKEKPRDPHTAKQVLNIVTPKIITENLKLMDLIGILDLAETKMGFERPKKLDEAKSTPSPETGAGTSLLPKA